MDAGYVARHLHAYVSLSEMYAPRVNFAPSLTLQVRFESGFLPQTAKRPDLLDALRGPPTEFAFVHITIIIICWCTAQKLSPMKRSERNVRNKSAQN